jgi:hypothetical protein
MISTTTRRPPDPQQFNLYVYARNNPLKFNAPTGLDITVTGAAQDEYRKRLQKDIHSFQIAIKKGQCGSLTRKARSQAKKT